MEALKTATANASECELVPTTTYGIVLFHISIFFIFTLACAPYYTIFKAPGTGLIFNFLLIDSIVLWTWGSRHSMMVLGGNAAALGMITFLVTGFTWVMFTMSYCEEKNQIYLHEAYSRRQEIARRVKEEMDAEEEEQRMEKASHQLLDHEQLSTV